MKKWCIFHLLVNSSNGCNGLGQDEARSLELQLGLSTSVLGAQAFGSSEIDDLSLLRLTVFFYTSMDAVGVLTVQKSNLKFLPLVFVKFMLFGNWVFVDINE